jgi:hypothetical protein
MAKPMGAEKNPALKLNADIFSRGSSLTGPGPARRLVGVPQQSNRKSSEG